MRDETRSQDARSFEFPEGVRRHALRRCGLGVTLPRRLMPLPTAFDRLARRLEETGMQSAGGDQSSRPDQRQGFYDPAVYRIYRSVFYPMRTLEFAVWRWGEPEDDVRRTWLALYRLVPPALEQFGLPGYMLVDKENMLISGSLALRFEYVWDGPGDRVCGGDHALAIALPLSDCITFILHHCPGDHWDTWAEGLDDIFASLSLVELEGSPRWKKA